MGVSWWFDGRIIWELFRVWSYMYRKIKKSIKRLKFFEAFNDISTLSRFSLLKQTENKQNKQTDADVWDNVLKSGSQESLKLNKI